MCCQRCGKGGNGLTMPLTGGALAAMQRVLYGDPKRLYSFTLAEADLNCEWGRAVISLSCVSPPLL